MGNVIINAALKYIEKNPEVVEELVHLAISKVIEALRKQGDGK